MSNSDTTTRKYYGSFCDAQDAGEEARGHIRDAYAKFRAFRTYGVEAEWTEALDHISKALAGLAIVEYHLGELYMEHEANQKAEREMKGANDASE